MRERKLGLVIVFALLVFLGFILWNWIETCYRRRQLFDLYFPVTVQGLSVGANVIIDGRKIGQVESIRLQDIAPQDPRQNYVVVTVYADLRQLWNLPGKIDSESYRESVEKQIEYGLRARLRLPSLIADGLCVEFFYDRSKPAFFADDPLCENIEIPTFSRSLSQYIDQINARIEEYRLQELSERLLGAEDKLRSLNKQLQQTDFNALNNTLVSKSGKLRQQLESESLRLELDTFNAAIERFSRAVADGNRNAESAFKDCSEKLKTLSEQLDAPDSVLNKLQDFDLTFLSELNETLKRYRDSLKAYDKRLKLRD
jgi:ABC-type transporter Mla subunit MlaD